MPAHDRDFRHVDDFSLQPPLNVGGATRAVLQQGWAQLRRLDDVEDRFVPGGTYRESWIVFPNWRAAGIQSLYGFRVRSVLTGQRLSDVYGGSFSFQLSNNNGVSWLYHNGSGWAAAGSGDWNTEYQVDKYLVDFPLTVDKEIRLKLRLTPSADGQATPRVDNVTIFADLEFNFQEDLLRSMQDWLERNAWVSAQYFTQSPQPTTDTSGATCAPVPGDLSVMYLDDKKWEEFSEPASVYNLTTDPNRTTNLFSGFIAGGIQLTSPQEGTLEANFMARPPVYIGAEEFMQLSSIPSIVVQLGAVKERRDMRWGNDEIDYSVARLVARRNFHRVYFDAQFKISCQSDLKAEATRMSDAVNKALSHQQFVPSLQTGEEMPVPYDTPIVPTHRVAQGLFVREYSCTLYGKTWLRRDLNVDRDLAQEVVILTHPGVQPPFMDVETMEVN